MKIFKHRNVTHQKEIDELVVFYKGFQLSIIELREAFKKAMKLEEDPYEDIQLFPLSQFRLRNPCKKCIVRAVCGQVCDIGIKHKKLRVYLKNKKSKLIEKISLDNSLMLCLWIVWGGGILLLIYSMVSANMK